MNAPTTSAKLWRYLRTPRTTDQIMEHLGVTRQRVHVLIFKSGSRVRRVDTTPNNGPNCRAAYALTNHP